MKKMRTTYTLINPIPPQRFIIILNLPPKMNSGGGGRGNAYHILS